MILIIGGSGSGKSACAEEYAAALSEDSRRYYIATMRVNNNEGQAKVERHKRMRRDKGFNTIEQPVAIEKVMDIIGLSRATESTALLECMSNLVANEMFSGAAPKSREEVTEKIIQGINQLSKGFKNLVVVTNNVFEDGIIYDETTMSYIKAMGIINEKLAAMADKVLEVVVGIPVVVKEGK